jgi:hypothetical protein
MRRIPDGGNGHQSVGIPELFTVEGAMGGPNLLPVC